MSEHTLAPLIQCANLAIKIAPSENVFDAATGKTFNDCFIPEFE